MGLSMQVNKSEDKFAEMALNYSSQTKKGIITCSLYVTQVFLLLYLLQS